VVRGWRNVHEELHNLYASPNVMRVMMIRRVRGLCSMHKRNEYKIFIGKPEGKRLFGRPRRSGRIILE
jgi:hypothetical protein